MDILMNGFCTTLKHNHWIVLTDLRLTWHSTRTSRYSNIPVLYCQTTHIQHAGRTSRVKINVHLHAWTHTVFRTHPSLQTLCPSTQMNDYSTFIYIIINFLHGKITQHLSRVIFNPKTKEKIKKNNRNCEIICFLKKIKLDFFCILI